MRGLIVCVAYATGFEPGGFDQDRRERSGTAERNDAGREAVRPRDGPNNPLGDASLINQLCNFSFDKRYPLITVR